jgi:hypothetical protein
MKCQVFRASGLNLPQLVDEIAGDFKCGTGAVKVIGQGGRAVEPATRR